MSKAKAKPRAKPKPKPKRKPRAKPLPNSVGWHPWRKTTRHIPDPRYVQDDPKNGGYCVMKWKLVPVPVAKIGGIWGKRIKTLDPPKVGTGGQG